MRLTLGCLTISVRSSAKCSRITLSANSCSAGVIEATGLLRSTFFTGFPLNHFTDLRPNRVYQALSKFEHSNSTSQRCGFVDLPYIST